MQYRHSLPPVQKVKKKKKKKKDIYPFNHSNVVHCASWLSAVGFIAARRTHFIFRFRIFVGIVNSFFAGVLANIFFLKLLIWTHVTQQNFLYRYYKAHIPLTFVSKLLGSLINIAAASPLSGSDGFA